MLVHLKGNGRPRNTACGGPGPDETRSPPALDCKEMNRSFLFPIHFFALLFCIPLFCFAFCLFVFCFQCLFALSPHSPVLFLYPSSTSTIIRSWNVTACAVSKRSHAQQSHQYRDNPNSSRGTEKKKKDVGHTYWRHVDVVHIGQGTRGASDTYVCHTSVREHMAKVTLRCGKHRSVDMWGK